jgi:hypothetical protein
MAKVPGKHGSRPGRWPERLPFWTAVFGLVAAVLSVLTALLVLVHQL